MTDAAVAPLPARERRRRSRRRAIAGSLALAVAFGAGTLAAPAPEAEAAVVTPMTNIFDATVNGNYLMVGNGVMQAGAAATTGISATDFHNGTEVAGQVNDNFTMQRRNAVASLVAAGADNSTSATLQVPLGASISRAFLFWQGSTGTTGVAGGGTAQRCTPSNVAAATLPAGQLTSRQVMLQVGSGAIANVAGSYVVEPTPTIASPQYYSAQADVTAQLASIPTGSTQTINVGNIWAPEGRNCYAGWSLAVVYDFGGYNAANPLTQSRQVIISSGHVRVQQNESVTSTFSGFTSQSGDIQASFFLGEGDRNITGDYARYRGGTSGAFTTLQGVTGEAANIGTSQAAGSVRFQGTSTGTFYNGSVDVRTAPLQGIAAGTTQVQLELGTQQDTYMLQATALAVPVASVRIEKSFTGAASSAVDVQHLLPGDVPSYTITVTNTGSTTVTNLQVSDQLSASCVRTLGSLAPGASTQFTCTGPPVGQTGFTTTATVTGQSGTTTLTSSDSTRVNVATLSLLKSVTSPGSTGRAGDVLSYTFAIQNTGTSPLTSVALTDPMPGLQGLAIDWTTSSDPATPAGTLSPGETVIGRASYTLTQANVNAGSVTNPNARVTGSNPNGAQVAATSQATYTVPANPVITLSKTAALAAGATGRAGDTVTYTFQATNQGNVTLTNVAISDPMPGLGALTYRWPTGTPNVLQPGQTVTATATMQLTQAQVNAGSVSNTATITGTPPSGPAVTRTADATLTVTAAPSLTVRKVGTVTGSGAAGDQITYAIDVTNSGNVTLTGVTVSDPGVETLTPPAGFSGTLQPGQTVRWTGSHVITQPQVDAGSYANTATASGTPPTGSAVTASGSAVAPLANAPGIDLDKLGTYQPGGPGNADDTILYTFTLTNSGRATLTNVALSDPALAGIPLSYQWPGAAGTLAPGQVARVTATMPVTQAMIDAGRVDNVATATATGPGGVQVSDPGSSVVTIPAIPSLTLTKTATVPGESPLAGTGLPYAFRIVNTGNVTLSGVAIEDAMFEAGDLAYAWPGAAGVLAPGQAVDVAATHPLTQAEIDAGAVANTATATGLAPGGQSASQSATVTVALPRTTSLDLVKTATLADGDLGLVGDTIEYDLRITNDGTTTLTDVSLDDALDGLDGPTLVAWPGEEGVLLPGESVDFTASYVITQDDLDAQGVLNTATATGSGPGDATATDVAAIATPLVPEPAIALTKDVTVPEGARAGDVLAYDFLVENVGTATLSGVRIDDPLLGQSAVVFGAWPDPLRAGVLAPGQTVEATASYVLTQADVDAGRVVNEATAIGTSTQGVEVTDSDDAVATIAQPQALVVTKIGALRGPVAVGSVIDFTIAIENDGATTLTDVTLVDELEGLGDVTIAWPDPAAPGVLAPGAIARATAEYVLQQADVDAGVVTNAATATATGPAGPVASDEASASVPLAQTASMTLLKSVSAPARTVGSTFTYTFAAVNTGNVTLTDVTVADPLPGLSALDYDWSGAQAPGVLAPGQGVTATATYVLTQADADAGSVPNTAVVTGLDPAGADVEATASRSVTVPGTALVRMIKVGVAEDGVDSVAGDTIDYTFTILNTGTVTLTGFAVSDPLVDDAVVIDWSTSTNAATGEDALAPGESVTATASYVLTQDDVNAGLVRNDATVTATGANGQPASFATDYTNPLADTPNIEILKGAIGTPTAVGDVLTYTFDVTNNGAVTLTDVRVEDPLPNLGPIVFDWSTVAVPGTLQPGETARATAELVIQQSNLDAGIISNTATAFGTGPGDETVDADSNVATFVQAAQVELVKEVVAAGAAPGQPVSYRFTVTNTGNATLTNPTISDPLLGDDVVVTFDWETAVDPTTGVGVLAPGESVVGTADYVLTVADLDAGTLTNDAVVTAQPPAGQAVSAEASVTTTLAQSPAITLDKSTDAVEPAAGETITYTFTAQNAGNATLSDVTIVDPLPGLSALDVDWAGSSDTSTGEGVLAPGETVQATATYTVTQADVDAGGIDNTASVRGVAPLGGVATATASERVDITTTSGFTFAKSITNVGGAGLAGDVVTYAFTLENTGTTTLTDVVVTDPLPGLTAITIPWPGAPGVLPPGSGPIVGTASYVITQADVDAGIVANAATATATAPGGPLPEQTSTADLPLAGVALVELTKSGIAADGPASVAGDAIAWSFTIRNAGSLTLSAFELVDAVDGVTTPVIDWSTSTDATTGDDVLAPGESVQATATSTITQAQVDAGLAENQATVTALPAPGAVGGQPERIADEASAQVPFEGTPLLTLAKTHDVPQTAYVVGDDVVYRFEIANAGTETIDEIALDDPLEGLRDLEILWSTSTDDGTPDGTLAPGETVQATALLEVTQALIDAGRVDNVAVVTGADPAGAIVTATDDDTVLLPQRPSIALVKTQTLVGSDATDGRIDYGFVIENDGTTTLSAVELVDDLPGLQGLAIDWSTSTDPDTDEGVLSPGETVTGSASYPLSQADVDAGQVRNAARADAIAAGGIPVTEPASAITVIPQVAGIRLEKSTTAVDPAVGETITYDFRAENPGNVTLTDVSIADALEGISAVVYDWPGEAGTLSPGDVLTGTATYVVTQGDVDRGSLVNEATIVGTAPNGTTVTFDDDASVTFDTTASLELTKSTTSVNPVVDETIVYDFLLENDGDVTLSIVQLFDRMLSDEPLSIDWASSTDPSTPAGVLAPGESVRASAEHVVTQAEIDAGGIDNLAEATAQPPTGQPLTTDATERVDIVAPTSIEIVKGGTAENGAASVAGDEVLYTFRVENTGATTLANVAITDVLPGVSVPVLDWAGSTDPSTPDGVLSPGEAVEASATYALTQADVDAGGVVNEVLVTATDPDAQPVTDEDVYPIALEGTGALTLTKTPLTQPQVVGDPIVYELVASNVGAVTLTDVVIDDPLPGLSALEYAWPDPAFPGRLLPGQDVVATASVAVTQADLDALGVDNVATVSAQVPEGVAPVEPAIADARVELPFRPGIALEKTGTVLEAVAGGDVRFDLTVTNTGNVTLTDVALRDELDRLGPIIVDWAASTDPATDEGVLSPGEQMRATAVYALTQADLEVGSIANDATVVATTPATDGDGDPILVDDDASVVVPIAGTPVLTIEKSTEVEDPSVGDAVPYTIVATNSGTVRLTGVEIVDPLIPDLEVVWPDPDAPGVLEVGESATATGSYVVTPADADAGSIMNVATATGTGRGGQATGSDEHELELVPSPSIALTKDGSLVGPGAVGDTVSYVFAIENTGDVTLTDVVLADPLPGLEALAIAWGDSSDPATGEGVLSAGETVTATATYALTQADVDAGSVANEATVTATGPTGSVDATASDVVVSSGTALIALDKTGTAEAGAESVAGDAIAYDFLVTNVGTTTLEDVAIDDPMEGLSDVVVDWSTSSDPATPEGVLAPGESVRATAAYVLTQADVDAGVVENTATASGTTLDGTRTVEQEDTAEVPLGGTPALAIDKSHVGEPTAVGDVVEYRFLVTNAGTVTIADVAVVDELDGLSTPVVDWATSSDPATGEGILAPGETVLATASYTIVQADVDRGSVTNTAIATGVAADGGDVASPSDADAYALPQSPSLSLVKEASADGAAAGATVTYDFTVVNDGTVTLDGVTIADALPGLSEIAYDWDGSTDPATGEGVLSPGETVTATATYVLTQADVDAGGVVNAAEVSGTVVGCDDAACATVDDDDAVTTPLAPVAALEIVKGADRERAVMGDVVTYAFTVENVGTVTLTDVTIDDRLEGLSAIDYAWPGEPGVLAPGERVTATATYEVTRADAIAGGVTNVAVATGTAPGSSTPVEATDEVEVEVLPPGQALPPTGFEHGAGLALAALVLLLLGAALVLRRRARRA
ncbi:DUF7507 domain-containing protein [Agrococcus sp. SGAir0287]|uniref:DUF7507 domain-containing protein n=1 Tax=Agrococcus sp. SGAir0287 TaxID=2070347 RepID=UPI0010CD3B09|nr:DUF11 domain-containing protein [Agrococcus sp. SGAir0287]QCR18322.1 hypothetical protein C1N71_01700 [Agrococcus sp. SGAir0287]